MTHSIGDIVYCTVPMTTDTNVIAIVSNIQEHNKYFRLVIDILYSDNTNVIGRNWNTTSSLVITNFGRTDLNTIRQTNPEYFI